MNWLNKIFPPRISRSPKKSVPQGVWAQCPRCQTARYSGEHEKNLWVCTNCNFHERITPEQRMCSLFDSFEDSVAIGIKVKPTDFLNFSDVKPYSKRLSEAQNGDTSREALSVRRGAVDGAEMAVAVFDFTFMGGSMGSVVGERFVLGIEEAIHLQLPFICFSASGGARMQEGLTSLFQMGKTTAAIQRLNSARLPYISILTDPTTGGVAASLAMVGDVIIAEPEARIGFAGPRVIQETVREILPEGFQSSEFLLKHGAIDMIVDRRELRSHLSKLTEVLMHTKRHA